MKCKKYESQIALYIGRDLPPGESAEVAAHIEVCPGCRELAEALKGDREALAALIPMQVC